MSFLFKLLEPVRANPLVYSKGIFLRITIVGVELGIIVIMQNVAHGIETKDIELLQQQGIIFTVGIFSYYFLKRFARSRSWPRPGIHMYTYLWNKYLRKVISSESSYIEKIGTGKLIETVKSGFDTWVNTIETLISRLPELLIKPLFACWILYHVGPLFALGFIIGIIILSIISIRLNNRAIQTRYKRKEIKLSMAKRFVRFLNSRLEILYAGKGNSEIQAQLKDVIAEGNVNIELNNYLYLMFNIPIFSIQLLSIISIYYAIQGITNGTFSYAIFTGLVTIIGFMTTLMIEITAKFKDISRNIVDIEKLREYLEDAPQMTNYDTGEIFIYKNGAIDIKNLAFTYNEGSKVFDNFSLSIQGGKKTAFVGNSGSGKSTLVKLISGLLSPDEGTILIDGQDLSKVSLKSFYQHIGFLQQEPIIFDGTVRENILYGLNIGLPSLEERGRGEDLHSIIQKSQCSFIYDLPNGLDTEVGERGVRLSGGQKQRLAIARIFAKNPDIIILDEPTSALDSFAEEEITKAMHELCKDKTVLIIAHRLQTVKESDEIIVLSPGEHNIATILERGTHRQLIENNGHYAKMLELQAGF